MDIREMIRQLQQQRRELEMVIAALEELEGPRAGLRTSLDSLKSNPKIAAPRRRGRKFMNALERREVSERMKRYWSRRKAGESAETTKPDSVSGSINRGSLSGSQR